MALGDKPILCVRVDEAQFILVLLLHRFFPGLVLRGAVSLDRFSVAVQNRRIGKAQEHRRLPGIGLEGDVTGSIGLSRSDVVVEALDLRMITDIPSK